MATQAWEQPRDEAPAGPAVSSTSSAAGDATAPTTGGGSAGGDLNELKTDTPGKRKRRMLTESHLLSAEGLKKIHRTFSYQVSSDVSGQEAKALRSLINMYKQWAFDLYPGLNFEDFLERTEFLGRQHGVQGLMSDLREKERKRALRLEREAAGDQDGDGVDVVEEEEEEETRPDALATNVVGQEHHGDRHEGGEEAML